MKYWIMGTAFAALGIFSGLVLIGIEWGAALALALILAVLGALAVRFG